MLKRFSWKTPLREFSWSNLGHVRDTLGKQVLKYKAEDLPQALRQKRDERVAVRWIKWFHSQHRPLDELEAHRLFEAFANNTDETPAELAGYFFQACGRDKQAAIARLNLIENKIGEAVRAFLESEPRLRLDHHVRNAFTVPKGLSNTVRAEINKLRE